MADADSFADVGQSDPDIHSAIEADQRNEGEYTAEDSLQKKAVVKKHTRYEQHTKMPVDLVTSDSEDNTAAHAAASVEKHATDDDDGYDAATERENPQSSMTFSVEQCGPIKSAEVQRQEEISSAQIQNLMKRSSMASLAAGGGGTAPKDLQSAKQKRYDFRDTQPVPKFSEDVPLEVNGPIDEDQPQGFEWDTLHPSNSPPNSKNKLRKKKKKTRAQRRAAERQAATERATAFSEVAASDVDSGVEVEYIQEAPLVDRSDPLYSQFSKIFETFKIDESSSEVKTKTSTTEVKSDERELVEDTSNITKRGATHFGELEGTEPVVDKSKLSKKQLKKLTRVSVADLKTVVSRPDLVEMHDITGPDPRLLLSLKATRNTVLVPKHWCNKRKYLQGKRGVEKPPFELPDYIVATGIMEMRQALAEKEEEKSLKQKMREKVRPKMGKIDIDYQKLHDAFFKHQRRPKITMHGELYYEGKEFETKLKEKKPGNLSDALRSALGMPIGAGAEKFPPPWLIAMQRYGPPPSYPNLKIAGLNAAIPDGCLFGYHAGGWGKPPVDETGRPLYGDVFGQRGEAAEALPIVNDLVDMTAWGEMESDSSEEGDSSDESGDDGDRDDLAAGLVTPADAELITPSGITSIPAGIETPDAIELRKKIEESMDVGGGDTLSLYQVLPEKRANVGAAMMGSAHTYDMGGAKRFTSEGIEIALNPEELDLDNVAMQAKYDQTVRAQQADATNEDLSDMVAEHAAKAAKKRKKQQATDRASKKHKEFKF